MKDLLTALGLVCVIEGAMYALFPEAMKRMTAQMALLPIQHLRLAGLVFAGFGFVIVGVLKGY